MIPSFRALLLGAMLPTATPAIAVAQGGAARALPLRQSSLDASAPKDSLSLRDVSQLDRWIGQGVRDARWAADGSMLYFRWPLRPGERDDPEGDPWWRADRSARWAEQVPDSLVWRIPGDDIAWSSDGRLAAWSWRGRVVVWDGSRSVTSATRVAVDGSQPARRLRIAASGRAVDYLMGDDLFRWDATDGTVQRLAQVIRRPADARTEAGRWLATQQVQLLDLFRAREARARESAARDQRRDPHAPQVIPLEPGARVDDVQLSPDGRTLTVRTVTSDRTRPPTVYMDFVTASGYA
ncbi:MAG: hypothetical protein ACLGIK_15465, partial [Gemmatimonadota bacterium]